MGRIQKTLGIIRMPFVRIGGNLTFPPPICTRIQTDGSFRQGEGRVAAIIDTGNMRIQKTRSIRAESSTETEWASIAYGIQLALKQGHDALELENDNLGVIHALIHQQPLRHDYARHYYEQIREQVADTVWTGVRWIPRDLNDADSLF
jgi:hypothetical protein